MKHISFNAKSNEYVDVIPLEVFEKTPKAVWAAIAISLATCGGDRLDDAARAVVHEWALLNQNGIVPQSVPARLREYDRPDPDGE